MKKITEIKVEQVVTRHVKDENRQQVKKQVRLIVNRAVELVPEKKRIWHYIIDLSIFRLIIYLIEKFADYIDFWSYIPTRNTAIVVIILLYFYCLLAYVFYYFLFEEWLQATPGKLLTKAVVINEYGQRPTRKELVKRSFARLVPFEAFSCLSGRGWHDRWSNTWVVTREENQQMQELLKKED